MYKMANYLCIDIEELVSALETYDEEQGEEVCNGKGLVQG